MTINIRKTFVFIAVIAILLSNFSVFAQGTENIKSPSGRYFIYSQSGFLKTILGVEHNFDTGFTTNLTSFQLSLIKTFGIKTEQVTYYKTSNLGQNMLFDSDVSALKIKQDDLLFRRKFLPINQISWAIKEIYNAPDLTQTSGGNDVNIAVLDTGIFDGHADLKNRIKDCKDFTKGDNPRNSCEDKNGHGTHLAGIIAADGGADKKGIFGAAPGVNLFIYKVCESNGYCLADDAAAAINFASNASMHKINIILIGFGGSDSAWLVENAIKNSVNKNILIIAPAGNNGPNANSVDYPAFYSEVVSVGFTNQKGDVVRESSRGTNPGKIEYLKENGEVEFVAPGFDIESTWIDGGYKILSGSSLAAAFSAAVAAKLWVQRDNFAPQVRRSLGELASLNDLWSKGDDSRSGAGLLKMRNIIDNNVLTGTENENL